MTDNPKTMTEIAALELRKAIMRGDLPPGMRLVPAKLEEKLGLSRISIREAIRELVGSGLVASETHKGAFVAEPLDIDEIREIFELRYHLEGRAAYLGTRQISEADIIMMEMLVKEAVSQTNAFDAFFINQELHMILFRASGWKFLIKTIQRAFDQVLAFRSFLHIQSGGSLENAMGDKTYVDDYLTEHKHIIQLIRERDPEKVSKAHVSHLKHLGFDMIYDIYKEMVKNRHQNSSR